MIEGYEIFKKLVPVSELYILYNEIGKTINTRNDFNNSIHGRSDRKNSILLLEELVLINFNEEHEIFSQIETIADEEHFKEKVMSSLIKYCRPALSFLDTIDISYDRFINQYYSKVNYIDLNLSGLRMLLESIEAVLVQGDIIYFTEKFLSDYFNNKDAFRKRKHLGIDNLKEKLLLQEEYGVQAEIKAIEYEENSLHLQGINLNPKRISEIDVSAGFDILSYKSIDSKRYDKFIEVKSCADDRLEFFMTKNEKQVSKEKSSSYFLYLYNRETDKFVIIENPHKEIFEKNSGKWDVESQVYSIKSMPL